MMRVIALILGLIALGLGGLWTLQGLGLVQIAPIACVADCQPLEGPSVIWTLVGLVALAIGALAIAFAVARKRAG